MATATIVTRLSRGDVLPTIHLTSRDGHEVRLGERSNIGMPIVVWLPGEAPEPIAAAILAGRVADFRAAGARVCTVAANADAAASGIGAELSASLLGDPDRAIARAVGLDGPGIVVFEADFRIAAVISGSRFDEALAACTRIFERGAPTTLRSAAPVLLVPDVLEPELCRAVIDYWSAGEKERNRVVTADGAGMESDGLKRRIDVWLDDRALAGELHDRIQRRVVPALKKAFGYEAAKVQKLRIGCYDSADAGAFGKHRDNSTPLSAHRQFAMSLNLNTGAYEGGKLWFPEFGRQLYDIAAGGAMAFSCSLLHEALPVIAGRRFGIFGFFFDAAAAEADDRLHFSAPDSNRGS